MLEQVRVAIKALQISKLVLLVEIVRNANLKTKKLILVAKLDTGCASADWYITVLKIQTKTCKDGRQVKMKSF